MWKIWLIVAIIFAITEVYYHGFFLLWFSIGALVTLIASLFLHNFLLESIIFLTVSFILLLTLKKHFIKKLDHKKTFATNTNQLIGSHGIVIKHIGQNNLESGLVKLDGEVWSAISDSNHSISEGSLVEVKAIKGVRLIVASIKK